MRCRQESAGRITLPHISVDVGISFRSILEADP
jgi:hypothetical protein